MVAANERFGAEILYALNAGRSQQRAWLCAQPQTAQLLARSRRCAGSVSVEGNRWASDLPAVIIDSARSTRATHVIADDVATSAALAELGDRLEPALSFPCPPRETLLELDDKARFSHMARSIGLPIVDSVLVTGRATLDHGIDYPVVMKPPDGSGGLGICYCGSEEDLARALATGSPLPVLVERYVPGRDVHLTFLADNGELVAWEVHEPHPSKNIRYRACRFVDDDEAVEVGRTLARAVSYRGIANLDFRRDQSGELWLLECNPRVYARMGLATQVGVNFIALGLDLVDGFHRKIPVVARTGVVYSPLALPELVKQGRFREAAMAAVAAMKVALADPGLMTSFARRRLGLVRNGKKTTPASGRIPFFRARPGAGNCP